MEFTQERKLVTFMKFRSVCRHRCSVKCPGVEVHICEYRKKRRPKCEKKICPLWKKLESVLVIKNIDTAYSILVCMNGLRECLRMLEGMLASCHDRNAIDHKAYVAMMKHSQRQKLKSKLILKELKQYLLVATNTLNLRLKEVRFSDSKRRKIKSNQ